MPKTSKTDATTATPADYGAWDALPVDPRESELDLSQQDVGEAIERREVLKAQWAQYWHYSHGTWRTEAIAAHPEQAEAGRN